MHMYVCAWVSACMCLCLHVCLPGVCALSGPLFTKKNIVLLAYYNRDAHHKPVTVRIIKRIPVPVRLCIFIEQKRWVCTRVFVSAYVQCVYACLHTPMFFVLKQPHSFGIFGAFLSAI